jgi:hypothetical protein
VNRQVAASHGDAPVSDEDQNLAEGFPGLPLEAAGRWKTVDAYAMRRISTLRDANGQTIGYRPMIQQGRGQNRRNYHDVFRITSEVDAAMAMAMAQRWRDKKEAELGINSGQISSKSASRFVPGISLVVSTKPPFRAWWKWSTSKYPTVTKYMGEKKGFETSYREFVSRICELIGREMPATVVAPMPSHVQYASLRSMGVAELPDRRRIQRIWTAP